MRFVLAAVFSLLPLSAFAQQPSQTTPPTAPAAPTAQSPATKPAENAAKPETPKKEVPPDAPVITLAGACKGGTNAAPSDACKVVITRAEFEKIMNALAPEAPDAAKRQVAETYAQAMIVNNEALKEGVQNDPAADEVFKYAKMRAMGQLLARRVQKKALDVSEADIQRYFNENKGKFEEHVLTRVVVPKRTGTKQKPASPSLDKAYAERIRKRLLAGEKADALQKEAFARAAVKSPAPETNLGAVRRDALPPSQAQVFDLKPGQVSEVLPEASAFFIYKDEANTTPELDPKISDEIRKTIAAERLQQEAKRIGDSVKPELNPDYFGAIKAQPALPGMTVPSQPESSPK